MRGKSGFLRRICLPHPLLRSRAGERAIGKSLNTGARASAAGNNVSLVLHPAICYNPSRNNRRRYRFNHGICKEKKMHPTVLRRIGILTGVVLGLVVLFAIGWLVYSRCFAFVPDRGGMEATCFLLKVTPYTGGTDEFGNPVGSGEGESREYEISGGDRFYEDCGGTLVHNPGESDLARLAGLSFQVLSLDADRVTLLVDQEERTVMYGEEFVIPSLLIVSDGASTSYRMTITP